MIVRPFPGLGLGQLLGPPRPKPPALPAGSVLTHLARTAMTQALRALRIGPGDEVLLPAFHCGVEADAARHAGTRVRFYPVGTSLVVDPAAIERRMGAATRAVVAIHYFGIPPGSGRRRRAVSRPRRRADRGLRPRLRRRSGLGRVVGERGGLQPAEVPARPRRGASSRSGTAGRPGRPVRRFARRRGRHSPGAPRGCSSITGTRARGRSASRPEPPRRRDPRGTIPPPASTTRPWPARERPDGRGASCFAWISRRSPEFADRIMITCTAP